MLKLPGRSTLVPLLLLPLLTLSACAGEGVERPADARPASGVDEPLETPPSAPDTAAVSQPSEPAASEPLQPLPPGGIAWVIFGSDTVHAEVADTPALRERGLMERTELPEGRGMLFVFTESRIRSFWMRNTWIPLDIAYMDADFQIVDIQAMEPLSERLQDSAGPAMFALEVPQGWFAGKGIEVGARARVEFGRR